MKLFNGQLVVILQAAHTPGTVTLKVTDRQRGLQQTVDIAVR
jgi:beta-galactosidase